MCIYFLERKKKKVSTKEKRDNNILFLKYNQHHQSKISYCSIKFYRMSYRSNLPDYYIIIANITSEMFLILKFHHNLYIFIIKIIVRSASMAVHQFIMNHNCIFCFCFAKYNKLIIEDILVSVNFDIAQE